MEGRVFENFQKKSKKISKFQKSPKSFPKMSKRVLNRFYVLKGFAQCSMEGRVFENFQKKSKKFSKKSPKSFPKVFQTCFEYVLIISFAQCSMESILRKFSKKSKTFQKSKKCPKSFPKSLVQTCFEHVSG